eukprot:2499356-Prymnesium_polylepis.1
MPHACLTGQPMRAAHSSSSDAYSGAAAHRIIRSDASCETSTASAFASWSTIGGATCTRDAPCLATRSQKLAMSKRPVIETYVWPRHRWKSSPSVSG